jgi:hypothetical protein
MSRTGYAKVSVLDRAIAAVFPRWGLNRITARSGLGMAAWGDRAPGRRPQRRLPQLERPLPKPGLSRPAPGRLWRSGPWSWWPMTAWPDRPKARHPALCGWPRPDSHAHSPKQSCSASPRTRPGKWLSRLSGCWKVFARRADVTGRYSAWPGSSSGTLGCWPPWARTCAWSACKNPRPDRPISLALQLLDPLRLKTPTGRHQAKRAVHDGIQLGSSWRAPALLSSTVPKDGVSLSPV